eukprot:UN00978
MFMFIILLALVDLSFAGCHSGTITKNNHKLGLKTASVTNGGAVDGKIYARIFTYMGGWSAWRRLDTSSCNDFATGETDYFDDFDGILYPWAAVALYNCGTDGLAVSGIHYWDDFSKYNYISGFCGDVAGPFAECFRGTSSGSCGSKGGPFAYVWIDQNDNECHGIVVKTGSKAGTLFTTSSPGKPDCVGETGAMAPPLKRYGEYAYPLLNSVDDSTNEFNGMMILGAVIMILTVTMCVLISMMVKKNKNKRYYQEVEVVS